MKDYEISYDKPVINLQAVIFIGLILICVFFYIAPLFKQKEVITPVIKNESIAIQIEYVTVLVTPTPDGKLYFASEYESGIRKIQNPFTFRIDNASGLKDAVVKTVAYDFKRVKELTWFNDADNKWYKINPYTGYDYLIVYYAMYLDNRIGDNTQYNIPALHNFIVTGIENRDVVFYPQDYPKHLRYAELEYSYDYNNVEYAEHFGQHVEYSKRTKDKHTAGLASIEDTHINAGKSNAESGYLIYEIPKELKTDDIITGINFGNYGYGYWKLKV
jgi:hypothetical protein